MIFSFYFRQIDVLHNFNFFGVLCGRLLTELLREKLHFRNPRWAVALERLSLLPRVWKCAGFLSSCVILINAQLQAMGSGRMTLEALPCGTRAAMRHGCRHFIA